MSAPSGYFTVARIVAPFGVLGEVKAELLTDFPERLAKRRTVFLGREGEEPRAYALRGVRFHQRRALLALDGCDDRTAAEALRGQLVQIPETEAAKLPADTYYLHQIIGLQVWGSDGLPYGTITAILATPGNDVYVVEGERGRFLLPAVPVFVLSVDLEQNKLVAEMSGL